jgi:ParB family protein of integrating conjugative element (PFGI_1 class)
MTDPTANDMAARLLADGFKRAGPDAVALSDPVTDTPMVVTLDQLRPYELNPRVTRNPLYDDIKASIRERGLDAPPAVTRRPTEAHYIIRNGGNTRLAILRELWTETKDERFFRIACLFRPWSARGEIVALTGHLAENELHGSLSFIERALGVEKARELYEAEAGQALTQTELSRRLTADGYPIAQPHISRMQDATRHLLPAIPTMLYAGLGRPQVERLTALRRAGARVWETRAAGDFQTDDFAALFQDVLAAFDGPPDGFSLQRVQDELVGQMAERLNMDYDTLLLEMHDTEHRQRALTREPVTAPRPQAEAAVSQVPAAARRKASDAPRPPSVIPEQAASSSDAEAVPTTADEPRLQGHVVSPAATTERLQSIQRLVADQLGDAVPDFKANVLRAIPVQAGGLYPVSDVWYIEPALDVPDRLRVHIAQFAREIAGEAGESESIGSAGKGLGFICLIDTMPMPGRPMPPFVRAVLTLLQALSMAYRPSDAHATPPDPACLAETLGPLLQGQPAGGDLPMARLSDSGLVKLFRLLRLARRLVELETGEAPADGIATS